MSAEVREELLPLLPEAVTAGFVSQEIFATLRAMAHAEASVSFSALEDRLTERGKVLLHGALAADDIEEENLLRDQAQACLRRLDADAQKRDVDALRAAIKQAEREGRMEEALDLMVQLSQTEKKPRGMN